VTQFNAERIGFDLPPDAADKLVQDSGGNLEKRSLYCNRTNHIPIFIVLFIYCLCLDQITLVSSETYWEVYCHKAADLIVFEQFPARVMEVRATSYELSSRCVLPILILAVSATLVETMCEKYLNLPIRQ